MQNYIYLEPDTPAWHEVVAHAAVARDNRTALRIAVDGDVVKVKVGEGMWSPGEKLTEDPHRDQGEGQS